MFPKISIKQNYKAVFDAFQSICKRVYKLCLFLSPGKFYTWLFCRNESTALLTYLKRVIIVESPSIESAKKGGPSISDLNYRLISSNHAKTDKLYKKPCPILESGVNRCSQKRFCGKRDEFFSLLLKKLQVI